MVTESRYKKYEERKMISSSSENIEKKDRNTFAILDEIARMRGFKEKMIGKKKIRPIVQYVDSILETKYGFKTIKKGDKYFDRESRKEQIATKNISLIEQYIQLLKYKSVYSYKDLMAKQEGFESFAKKEEFDANRLGMTIKEYHTFLAEDMGFKSYEEYKKHVDGIYEIKDTYSGIIPRKDFDDVFALLKDKWIRDHEKFILFCEELWNSSLRPYFDRTKNNDAAILVDNITMELDKFHKNMSGSLNVYNIDDISIGLSHCLETKNIDVILSRNKRSIVFRKR